MFSSLPGLASSQFFGEDGHVRVECAKLDVFCLPARAGSELCSDVRQAKRRQVPSRRSAGSGRKLPCHSGDLGLRFVWMYSIAGCVFLRVPVFLLFDRKAETKTAIYMCLSLLFLGGGGGGDKGPSKKTHP